jgi:hypothetical protein
MTREYVEPDVIVAYLWKSYGHLFSDNERAAIWAMIGEGKTSHVRDVGATGKVLTEYVKMVHEGFGSIDTPETQALLANGISAFWRRACDRVLREHGDSIIINRCSRCARIVATPGARQCLWCHYDWHESR